MENSKKIKEAAKKVFDKLSKMSDKELKEMLKTPRDTWVSDSLKDLNYFSEGEMTREEKNSLAYNDCLEVKEPTMHHDEEYMQCYRYWRSIAQFPEDQMCWED